MIEQKNLTPEALFEILKNAKREKLLAMAKNARSLCRPHAAAVVADQIEKVSEKKAS